MQNAVRTKTTFSLIDTFNTKQCIEWVKQSEMCNASHFSSSFGNEGMRADYFPLISNFRHCDVVTSVAYSLVDDTTHCQDGILNHSSNGRVTAQADNTSRDAALQQGQSHVETCSKVGRHGLWRFFPDRGIGSRSFIEATNKHEHDCHPISYLITDETTSKQIA